MGALMKPTFGPREAQWICRIWESRDGDGGQNLMTARMDCMAGGIPLMGKQSKWPRTKGMWGQANQEWHINVVWYTQLKWLAQGYMGLAESVFKARLVWLQDTLICQWHQDALYCWDSEQAGRGSYSLLSCLAHGHGQINTFQLVIGDQSTGMPAGLCCPFLYPRNRHLGRAWAIMARTFHVICCGCLNSTHRVSTDDSWHGQVTYE